MLFGAFLLLCWLVLLIRYPRKALPISFGALVGLALVASWVIWQEARDARQLSRLQLSVSYAPDSCPADRPLAVQLKNDGSASLHELNWEIAAYRPGETVNLAQRLYDTPRYTGPADLPPGESWNICLPMPTLRSGYRPSTLEFRAERLQGTFTY